MLNINTTKFNETIAAAKAAAPANWAHKIDHAADVLLTNPYIHDTGDGLLILSDSGNVYHAKSNGKECGCKARQHDMTCWHRLADRLYRLYLRGN